MADIRAVLFDLVGTLLDEASDYEALDNVMAAVQERYRLDATAQTLSGEFALALMEILRGEGGPDEPDAEPAEFVPFAEAAPAIFAAILEVRSIVATDHDRAWFWSAYMDTQRAAWRAFPEVVPVLTELRAAGLRIVVVTDSDRYLADEMLPRLGLDKLVDAVVCAEDAGFVKPHHALFVRGLKAAGVDATAAAFVGDSYERDIVGAANVGIRTRILVDRHEARNVDEPSVRDLTGVPAALGLRP